MNHLSKREDLGRAMYKVGIVGAGVGGSYLAYLLAREGVDTIVFDFRAPHEKLCGGCVTSKAVERFSIINELPCPRYQVRRSTIISPHNRIVTIELDKPVTMFNRRDLDYSMLAVARQLGAHFRKEKVLGFTREENHWRIFTEKGDYKAEIVVGADGALSRTRKALQPPPTKTDYLFALECFVDVKGDSIIFKFFPDLHGYLWEFPRVDRLGVGIVSKYGRSTVYHDMKKKLLDYIEGHFPTQKREISLRGAYIPLFSAEDIKGQRICSGNWALIGDAASFVDPISGEGIYYAMYSADILASCIIRNDVSLYGRLCEESICENLYKASRSFEWFYGGEFIETMIVLAVKSRTLREMMSEVMGGGLSYLSWKWEFVKYWVRLCSAWGWQQRASWDKDHPEG
jgi:geranylgeranyl reductase family protein